MSSSDNSSLNSESDSESYTEEMNINDIISEDAWEMGIKVSNYLL
jgi:hypothetical protein